MYTNRLGNRMKQLYFFFFLCTALAVQTSSHSQAVNADALNTTASEQKVVAGKKPIGNRVQNALVKAKTYVTENVQKLVDKIPKREPESKVVVIRNHTRLKRWMFNKNFRKEKSTKDILYHTFHPVANYFIEKYGKRDMYNAGKFSGIKYSLDGQIQFPNGTKKNVMFSITRDHKGSWYHREIKFHNPKKLRLSSDPFKPKIIYYKFGNKGALRSLIYFENNKWVKIYDAANDVTLYLLK